VRQRLRCKFTGGSRTTAAIVTGLTLVAFAASAPGAAARYAYLTGNEQVVPVDVSTGTPGATVAVPGFAPRIAISPDGTTAYVSSSGTGTVVPVDLGSGLAGVPIPVGGTPWGVAIAPDGRTAYAATQSGGTIVPIDVATNTAEAPIELGASALDLAISPDRRTAYVVSLSQPNVYPVDLVTRTVGTPIPLGGTMVGDAIGITPDGSRAYVATNLSSTVPIDLATGSAGTPIPGTGNIGVAVSPDGRTAFVGGVSGNIVPIDTGSNTAGAPIAVGGSAFDVAISPDGRFGIATNASGNDAGRFDALGGAVLAPAALNASTIGAAVVPDQPPHAAFAGPSTPVAPGRRVEFDAGSSTDPDGVVARYDWEFGDGSVAADAGPAPAHVYAKPGTYETRLRLTDQEGCSTQFVFAGHTAYCNGSSVAAAARTVTVSCPTASATSTSFRPAPRGGRMVQGVRVKVTVAPPAIAEVVATLRWRSQGRSHRAKLGRHTIALGESGKLRLALPATVRGHLALGAKVHVSLSIALTPQNAGSCAARTVEQSVSARVVRLLADRIAKRPQT
jgi:DNA-binding beta-propeller fold protein YncE